MRLQMQMYDMLVVVRSESDIYSMSLKSAQRNKYENVNLLRPKTFSMEIMKTIIQNAAMSSLPLYSVLFLPLTFSTRPLK